MEPVRGTRVAGSPDRPPGDGPVVPESPTAAALMGTTSPRRRRAVAYDRRRTRRRQPMRTRTILATVLGALSVGACGRDEDRAPARPTVANPTAANAAPVPSAPEPAAAPSHGRVTATATTT